MLVSSFNLSQSFNYTPYLLNKKRFRDQFFLHMDPAYGMKRILYNVQSMYIVQCGISLYVEVCGLKIEIILGSASL